MTIVSILLFLLFMAFAVVGVPWIFRAALADATVRYSARPRIEPMASP
jgi:hypothetical protein